MKTAIVHDWLVTYAGAERVLEQMLLCYPEADLFSLIDFLPAGERAFLHGKTVQTSFLQHLPLARRYYRSCLPLMPLAVEQFDLSGYDLVLSSSHAVAKGVLTGPDQLHLSYVYTPIRYAWDLQHQYLRETGLSRSILGWVARRMLHRIRIWDYRTANGVDGFVASSRFIARRIWKIYRRESAVIHPPVDVSSFTLCEDKEDFYLTVSRLTPYKRVDLIVEAFAAMPGRKLLVIGDGPEFRKIKRSIAPNIELLGYQPHEILRHYMQRARAFVFAAEEDFGIAPVEAQACGTPVIAYGRGGVLDSIRGLETDSPTGVFFTEQSVPALVETIELFEREESRIRPVVCRENALRFAPERFRRELKTYVAQRMELFQAGRFGGMREGVHTEFQGERDVTAGQAPAGSRPAK